MNESTPLTGLYFQKRCRKLGFETRYSACQLLRPAIENFGNSQTSVILHGTPHKTYGLEKNIQCLFTKRIVFHSISNFLSANVADLWRSLVRMERITVNIYDAELPGPLRVEVNSTDTVSVLAQYLPETGPKLLMYNGCFLMNAFTFAFFGIQDNSDLYFVKARPSDVKQRRPKSRMTRPRPRRGLEREKCRVADIIMQRVESNYRTMRKMSDRFTDTYTEFDNDNTRDEASCLKIYTKRGAPSTDTLPVLWNVPTEAPSAH